MLLSGSPLFAQSNSSKQLIVTSASVDRSSDTVTLKGSGFGNKKPTVFCELTQMTVLSATDEEWHERARLVLREHESPTDSPGRGGPGRTAGRGRADRIAGTEGR